MWESKRDKIMNIVYENLDVHRELFCEAVRDHFHARLESGAYDKIFEEGFDSLIKAPKGSTLTITLDFIFRDDTSQLDFFKIVVAKARERERNALQGVRPGDTPND